MLRCIHDVMPWSLCNLSRSNENAFEKLVNRTISPKQKFIRGNSCTSCGENSNSFSPKQTEVQITGLFNCTRGNFRIEACFRACYDFQRQFASFRRKITGNGSSLGIDQQVTRPSLINKRNKCYRFENVYGYNSQRVHFVFLK